MQAAIKDGSFKKTQIDPMGFAPQNPNEIDIQATMKEQFSK